MRARVEHSLVKSLRAVPAFSDLAPRTLLKIVGTSANLFWASGSTIFAKGAEAEGLYLVVSGQVRIYDTFDGTQTEIARVGPGAYFGELSLLTRAVHSKTAEAATDCELVVLPAEDFEALLESDPRLEAHFRRTYGALDAGVD